MGNVENYKKLRIIKLEENRNDFLTAMGISWIALVVTGIAVSAAKNYLPGFLLENFPNSELATTLTKETLGKFKDEFVKYGIALSTTSTIINGSIAAFIQGRINKIIRQIVKARRPEPYSIFNIAENREFKKNETEMVKKELESYENQMGWNDSLKKLNKRG